MNSAQTSTSSTPTSILAEPPVAVVDTNVDAKGTRKSPRPTLEFLYWKEGQTPIAKNHYRPSKPELVPAEDLGCRRSSSSPSTTRCSAAGKAQPYHFADGGVFDQIHKPPSKPGHVDCSRFIAGWQPASRASFRFDWRSASRLLT
jgi:ABC-type sulfate transport system substrate-binding protein